MVRLLCQPGSNVAQVQWLVNDSPAENTNRYKIQRDSLLILNASDSDAGQYTCTSVETSTGDNYVTKSVTYELRLGDFPRDSSVQPLVQEKQNTLLALVITLTLVLLMLVAWNFYKGHFAITNCFSKAENRPQSISGCQEPLQTVDTNKPASINCSSSNNNHNRLTGLPNTGNQQNVFQ